MKLFYTNKPVDKNDFDRDVQFANPDYFERVNSQAKEVAVLGDYPNIVKAYKDVDIKVQVIEPEKKKKAPAKKKEAPKKAAAKKQTEKKAAAKTPEKTSFENSDVIALHIQEGAYENLEAVTVEAINEALDIETSAEEIADAWSKANPE